MHIVALRSGVTFHFLSAAGRFLAECAPACRGSLHNMMLLMMMMILALFF